MSKSKILKKILEFVALQSAERYGMIGLNKSMECSMMKKLILLVIIFVLLMGACSSRPAFTTINLSDVGPRAQGELSSSRDVVVTPGVRSNDKATPPMQEDGVRVSAITTEQTRNQVDKKTDVRVFTAQLQSTQVQISGQSAVEQQVNSALQQVAQQNSSEAETVEEAAEATFSQSEATKDSKEEIDFYTFSYSTTQTITRLDSVVFSVVSYSSGYSGEAYPTNSQSATNFDLTTGERLALGDILQDDAQETVYEMIVRWLESKTEVYNLFPMKDCLPVVESKFSPQNMGNQYDDWHLTDDGLTVFFNPYEISPHSSGIIKIELSYNKLAGALDSLYVPVSVDERPLGSFVVYYNTDPEVMIGNQETVRLAAGADRLIVMGVEPIYDISLTRVSWIGEQSVDIGTLYCANYLTAENMLVIELDGAHSLSTLCLRLNPGDGEERTIYFEPELKPGAYTYTFSGSGN